MKKKITHADGTVEELEGTAEEIAKVEQERKARKAPKKENKQPTRRILLEQIDALKKENEELKRKAEGKSLFEKLIEQTRQPQELPPYWPPTTYPQAPWSPYDPLYPYTWCSQNITIGSKKD